jgi:replicative DNA helicase
VIAQRLTKDEALALNSFVHTPSETSSNFVRFAREIQAHPGIKFGCDLDNHIIPLRPGRALGLLGRPGHNKTSLGGYIVLGEGRRIVAADQQDTHYALHVSWEQPVEELEAMYQLASGYSVTDVAWGRVPVDDVIRNSMIRPRLPVWIFGDSLYKSTLNTPPMTVEMVYHAIKAVWKEWGMTPSVMFFDYIQDIPVPRERDRYMQVSAAMRAVKRLAVQVKCPLVLGIQANQRTDDYATPIPTLRDAEWSAVIGQKLDVVLALWKPIRTWLPNEKSYIEVGSHGEIPNTEDLLVVKLLKQRFEKGYGIWPLSFYPETMALKDYKTRTIDLNDPYLPTGKQSNIF